MVWLEGLSALKRKSMTPSGVKSATFWLAASMLQAMLLARQFDGKEMRAGREQGWFLAFKQSLFGQGFLRKFSDEAFRVYFFGFRNIIIFQLKISFASNPKPRGSGPGIYIPK
jgi:hypothetical protein